MARRRYLSTAISTDQIVANLAEEYGDFAALLYTWLIPHAEDDGCIRMKVGELKLLVLPAFNWKTKEDIEHALSGMDKHGLIEWDRQNDVIRFPQSFFKYQTYISKTRREKAHGDSGQRDVAQNTASQRKTPQNTAKHREPAQNTAKHRKTPLCLGLGLSSGKDNSPTESEGESPTLEQERDIPVEDAPVAMRPTVEFFLLKSGHVAMTPEDLSAVRALEKQHTPTRVNQEIIKALERYAKAGKPATDLTLDYIYKSLQYQTSGKSRQLKRQATANKQPSVYDEGVETA